MGWDLGSRSSNSRVLELVLGWRLGSSCLINLFLVRNFNSLQLLVEDINLSSRWACRRQQLFSLVDSEALHRRQQLFSLVVLAVLHLLLQLFKVVDSVAFQVKVARHRHRHRRHHRSLVVVMVAPLVAEEEDVEVKVISSCRLLTVI